MTDSPNPADPSPAPSTLEAPTPGRLIRWLLVCLVVAAVALALFVLPAEYGIDPTGVGSLLGLDGLAGQGGHADLTDAPAVSSYFAEGPPSTETLEIVLAPEEEMELKLVMQEGAVVVFSWSTDGPAIYSDLHADPFGGFEGEDVRYREDPSVAESHGAIVAPFGGNHGWYWRNDHAGAVLVTLEVRGYFSTVKEMRAQTMDG